jgi:hypothetical protein
LKAQREEMKIKKSIILLVFLITLIGCGERAADIKNPKHYNKSGLKFSYPGNWTITSDDELDSFHSIIVETSGDGIVILQKYLATDAMSLKEFADEFSNSMGDELPIGEIVDTKNVASTSTEISQTFSIKLLGERVPHVRKFVLKKFGSEVCFLIYQVATEDTDKAIKGFELISSSMLKEEKKQPKK